MADSSKLESIKQQRQELEERFRKQRAQYDARIKQEEAKLATVERKRDTRRKVLLGALLTAWMDEDADMRAKVEKRLAKMLQKRIDFEVFDMPIPPEVAAKEAKKAAKAEAENAA